jgi:peptidylprolyl isomerase
MKHTILILMMAASTMAASAQAPTKPATTAAKPASTTTAKPATAATAVKLPPGVPVVKGIPKTLFTASLRYQEIKIGTGAVAEPNKLYKIFYTGWRAVDGVKFDSTDDHPRPPVMDKDNKPVLGADGKPVQGPPQPLSIPIGVGGTIMGFDQGLAGMKIGGKRRLFIPWQLAYGTRNMPDRGPDHPGIPPKSDLIFDVELVDVTDIPAPQPRPGMMGGARPTPGGAAGTPARPATPATPAAPNTAPAPAAPAAPASAPATTAPAAAPAPAASATPAAPATPAQPQPK